MKSRPQDFHRAPDIPTGGTSEPLRALRARRRDKRLARNALYSITARTRRRAA